MTAALRAGAQLLRRQGRAGSRDVALTALGVALPVALIVVLVGILTGLQGRADRAAWREPVAAPRSGTFVQQRTGDAFEGEPIDRVDVAPLASLSTRSGTDQPSPGAGGLPAPPGLPAFPAPGEVWVSPALAAEVASHPDDALRARWPGEIVGTIGDEGLTRPDELVVLVGLPAGALVPTDRSAGVDHRMGGPFTWSDTVRVSGFSTAGTAHGVVLLITALAAIGAMLLLVPALQLSAAAARFTTNRRSVRLAALRLAGATPGQILTMAAMEAVAASALGAAVGIAAAAVLLRPLSLVPLAGGSWFAGDLWPGLAGVAAIALVVIAVNTASVLVTLRRAASAPLGVVTGQRRRRPTALRLLVASALWTLFIASAIYTASGGSSIWPLALGTAAVVSSIAVLGPWLTWVLGALTARLARRTPLLLAGRRLQADPIGAFRPVGGIVLVGFVAGVILTTLPLLDRPVAASEPGRTELSVIGPNPFAVVTDDDLARPARVEGAITRDVIADAEARLGDLALGPVESDGFVLTVDVAAVDVERARTALTGVIPGHPALTEHDAAWHDRVLIGDLGRAAAVATLTMVVLAVLATGLAAAADILEQRSTLRALHLAGTSTSVLQRARDWQAALPLGGATVVSVTSGAAAGLVLLLAFGRDRLPGVPVLALALLMALGPLAGLVAARATRPLLQSATAA
jgi:hypothetical protein